MLPVYLALFHPSDFLLLPELGDKLGLKQDSVVIYASHRTDEETEIYK